MVGGRHLACGHLVWVPATWGGGRALDREPGQGSLQLLASLFYLLSLFFSFSFQAIYSME